MICLTYVDSSATPLAKVVDKARELYSAKVSRHLGQYKRKRLDKGVKKGPRTMLAGKFVEKTWINRRRASVKAAAAQSSGSGKKPVVDAIAVATYSAKIQKDRANSAASRQFPGPYLIASILNPLTGDCHLARNGAKEEDRSAS